MMTGHLGEAGQLQRQGDTFGMVDLGCLHQAGGGRRITVDALALADRDGA